MLNCGGHAPTPGHLTTSWLTDKISPWRSDFLVLWRVWQIGCPFQAIRHMHKVKGLRANCSGVKQNVFAKQMTKLYCWQSRPEADFKLHVERSLLLSMSVHVVQRSTLQQSTFSHLDPKLRDFQLWQLFKLFYRSLYHSGSFELSLWILNITSITTVFVSMCTLHNCGSLWKAQKYNLPITLFHDFYPVFTTSFSIHLLYVI